MDDPLDIAGAKLCAVLDHADAVFSALPHKFPCSVPLNDVYTLAFRKDGKDWRIFVIDVRSGTAYHARNSKLEGRVLAAKNLERLLEAMRAERAKAGENAEEAVRVAETFLAKLLAESTPSSDAPTDD